MPDSPDPGRLDAVLIAVWLIAAVGTVWAAVTVLGVVWAYSRFFNVLMYGGE